MGTAAYIPRLLMRDVPAAQQQVNDVYRDEPSKLNILPTLEYTSQDHGL
jgi:hypothetical protein